jgi:hypothetical protein
MRSRAAAEGVRRLAVVYLVTYGCVWGARD